MVEERILSDVEDFFRLALEKRKASSLYRTWASLVQDSKADFISNNYLGLANNALRILNEKESGELSNLPFGSTGSRLVSGNHPILTELEEECAQFFKAESCMFFQNGYLANLAILSVAAGRHDTYIYDDACHVSLKDGMRLSLANKYAFRHNDTEDLERKLQKAQGRIFILAESIYSMDGDMCPLAELLFLAEKYNARIILDEAHSTGTIGPSGKGLSAMLKVENRIWARIYTFGKALGASGAVLAISQTTKEYLTNFSHPVIYSTAPMPVHAGICSEQLRCLQQNPGLTEKLQANITHWNQCGESLGSVISKNKMSPVQYFQVSGNENALKAAKQLESLGYQTKAMLSPTVKPGTERLRISLHSFNSATQINELIQLLGEF
jgi:8-amino-7-oxononanoate synthase